MASNVEPATGWDNPKTARRYAEFTRAHSMYADTSRDLVDLAGVIGDQRVVDLCCGTGATTEAILNRLGAGGEVVAVDGSPAMLAEARAAVNDNRVRWVESPAEHVSDHAAGADAVLCNSAIWQTPMGETFSAVARVLREGGRFAFNIGRQFIAMPFTDEELHPVAPSLFDYMFAFATIDHRHVSGRRGGGPPPLTVDQVQALVEAAGLRLESSKPLEYTDTLERQRDWLSIPVFTERLLPGLSYEQRMQSLAKAYDRAAQDAAAVEVPRTARWMAFVAVAG